MMVHAKVSKGKGAARKRVAGKVQDGNVYADALARACSDRYNDPGPYGKGLASFEQTGGDAGPRWQRVLLLAGACAAGLLDEHDEVPDKLTLDQRKACYEAADKALTERDVLRVGPLYTRRGRAYSLFFPADADPKDLPDRRGGNMSAADVRTALQV